MPKTTIDTAELEEFAGANLEYLTHENLWDFVAVLAAELSAMRPDESGGIVRMDHTRQRLNIGWDAVTEHLFEVFDGLDRDEAKALISI